MLLLSALALAWTLGVGPTGSPWLAAKIVALFVYIGLGMVALRRRTPRRLRAAARIGALAMYGSIVSVVLTKSATGWFAAS